MTKNDNCIKDILVYINENTSVKVEEYGYHDITVTTPGIPELLDALSKEKYSLEEVAYNLIQCKNMGLAQIDFRFSGSQIKCAASSIGEITPLGMEFIQNHQYHHVGEASWFPLQIL